MVRARQAGKKCRVYGRRLLRLILARHENGEGQRNQAAEKQRDCKPLRERRLFGEGEGRSVVGERADSVVMPRRSKDFASGGG
jgi:hypothetical protein